MSITVNNKSVPGKPLPPKRQVFIILIAFGHTLRRDLLVTAREFIPFLLQVLVLPLSLLFLFGKVLPAVGTMEQAYPTTLLPGIVAFTIFLGSVLTISLSLLLDLSDSREIDDRLLAPLPVSLVAVEKVVFAALRAMLAGMLLLFLAYGILGNLSQLKMETVVPLLGIMLLYSLSSSALGLVIGAALPIEQMYLLFTVIFDATLYTGCVYYSWNSIHSLRALQIIALFNPMTYASEGLRLEMLPPGHSPSTTTLALVWILLGLSVSFIGFLILGIWLFRKRVIF